MDESTRRLWKDQDVRETIGNVIEKQGESVAASRCAGRLADRSHEDAP